MSILNKNRYEWQLFLAFALGAYGGFPKAPVWWDNLKKYELFKIFCLWLLIFVGGGMGEYLWTTLITLIVYIIMKFSDRYIHYGKDINNLDKKYESRFYN